MVTFTLAQTSSNGDYPIILEGVMASSLSEAIEIARSTHGGEWHEASDEEYTNYVDYFNTD